MKGCPSLQTAHYVGGNLRERPLERIWNDSPELAFNEHAPCGLYEIVLEPIDAPDPKPELKREYVKTRRWPR